MRLGLLGLSLVGLVRFPGIGHGSPVERFQLPNGLTVLVQVDRRLPLANVTSLYRVGSANERPGITGIAHYVEHMAFRATENVSHADVTGTIERIGGRWNGYTWIDETLYAATVPSWALESVLRIEAERMSRVLFDPEAFERERTSVIAELQGYENDPASILRDLAVAASFEIHPYRYNVIGWLSDVLAIERREALDFYRDFYGPNHAFLSVVGDVDPAEVRELSERLFGSLPRSRRSADVRVVEPPQRGEKAVTLRHPGTAYHLLFLFRAPAVSSADFPVLLVLDAVLAGGRGLLFGEREAPPGTPLRNAVVESGGFGASTNLTASRAPYVYEIAASAGSEEELERAEKALDLLLERLRSSGPTPAEILRARQKLRAEAAFESATLADVAHRLSFYEALGSFRRAEEILAALADVGADDVKRVATTYLPPERRTIGRHIPGESAPGPPASIPSVSAPAPATAEASPVPPRALLPVDLPAIERESAALPNGARLAAARREGGTASVHVRLRFGSALDPQGKEGLALLAARLVTGDSELAEALSEIGVRAEASAVAAPTAFFHREHFDLEVEYLPEDEEALFRALGRAFRRSDWSGDEVERVRMGLLDEIAALAQDASWTAERLVLEIGDGSFRPPFGTAESVRTLTREDVLSFLSPARVGGAVVASVVSPSPPTESLSRLGSVFAELPAGSAPDLDASSFEAEPRRGSAGVALAGKTQAEIAVALPGVAKHDEDALPLRLLAYVLGETGYAGRLGDRLVDSGLTYSVYTTLHFGGVAGRLFVRTAAAPANIEEVLLTVGEVFRELSESGVTESEWQECRGYRLGRLVVGLDSARELARALVESMYDERDLFDFRARSEEWLGVSRERLDDVARRYLREERLAVGVAGALSGWER